MPTKTSPTVIIRVSSLRNEPKYYDAKFVVSLLPQATTKQVLVYYAMQYIGVNSWDVSMPSTIMSHILYILDFEYLIRITYTLHIQTYHPLVHAWLHKHSVGCTSRQVTRPCMILETSRVFCLLKHTLFNGRRDGCCEEFTSKFCLHVDLQ